MKKKTGLNSQAKIKLFWSVVIGRILYPDIDNAEGTFLALIPQNGFWFYRSVFLLFFF